MVSILDKINRKPSEAIVFTLKGINNQTKRPDFRLNMGTPEGVSIGTLEKAFTLLVAAGL
jgi:hypothetical protein